MAAGSIQITGTAEVMSGIFLEMKTARPRYALEPHRIWIFSAHPPSLQNIYAVAR
jgi:hypothetical protein